MGGGGSASILVAIDGLLSDIAGTALCGAAPTHSQEFEHNSSRFDFTSMFRLPGILGGHAESTNKPLTRTHTHTHTHANTFGPSADDLHIRRICLVLRLD